jgi:hypothetical protein
MGLDDETLAGVLFPLGDFSLEQAEQEVLIVLGIIVHQLLRLS